MFKYLARILGFGWIDNKPTVVQTTITEDAVPVPVTAGRRSVQDVTSQFGSLSLDTEAGFNLESLTTLQHLAINDRYISRAVNNLAMLANSEEEIMFSKENSDAQITEYREHLNKVTKNWYMNAEGTTLNSALIRQVATGGALSAEAEIKDDLSGIKRIHLVSLDEIRFGNYNREQSNWPAYQLPQRSYSLSIGFNGLILLDYTTYSYMALSRMTGSPYGVPPMISALKDIGMHDSLVGGFEQVMKMVGMLGFLSVKVTPPKQNKASETESQYHARLLKYLDTIAPQIENGLSKGYVVGFKDSHEFDLQAAPTNGNQVKDMVDFVKKLIFEGLKQDPNFHGENMTVTETFGRVLLSIMSKDIESYQEILSNFKEKMYMMELKLAGYSPKSITVKFKKSIVGDKEKHENTRSKQIDNLDKLYNQGVISQDQRAKELGYDQPDQPEPRTSNQQQPQTEGTSNAKDFFFKLGGGRDGYVYDVPCGCDHHSSFADFKNKQIQEFIDSYLDNINGRYRSAISEAGQSIARSLKSLSSASESLTSQIIFTELFTNWEKWFKEPIREDVMSFVNTIYRFYRQDDSGFRLSKDKASFRDFDIPDAVFELRDMKAMDWLNNTDNFYLGKFITDPDTMERVRKFVAQEYIENGSPVGRSPEAIDAFMEAFEDLLWLERWKVRRIIETAVNNSRNFAQTMYIHQAGIEKYERVEVMDRNTCPFCRHINGKEFKVSVNVKTIEKITNGKPEDIHTISPFGTSVGIEKWESMNAEQIQNAGMGIGSIHPHCRGRWVAVI